MPGQALVHEGVVSRQQVEHAAIFLHHAFKEQLGFPPERLPEVVVEIGEQIRIGLDVAQIAELQPLAGKVVH